MSVGQRRRHGFVRGVCGSWRQTGGLTWPSQFFLVFLSAFWIYLFTMNFLDFILSNFQQFGCAFLIFFAWQMNRLFGFANFSFWLNLKMQACSKFSLRPKDQKKRNNCFKVNPGDGSHSWQILHRSPAGVRDVIKQRTLSCFWKPYPPPPPPPSFYLIAENQVDVLDFKLAPSCQLAKTAVLVAVRDGTENRVYERSHFSKCKPFGL